MKIGVCACMYVCVCVCKQSVRLSVLNRFIVFLFVNLLFKIENESDFLFFLYLSLCAVHVYVRRCVTCWSVRMKGKKKRWEEGERAFKATAELYLTTEGGSAASALS